GSLLFIKLAAGGSSSSPNFTEGRDVPCSACGCTFGLGLVPWAKCLCGPRAPVSAARARWAGFGRARGPEEGSVGRPTIGASARATADSGASAFSAVSNKLSEGAGNVVPALFANCVVGLGHAVASIG